MSTFPESARPLVELQPTGAFFVGIDSDGCAFDTMEIKHKECFIPNIIKYWDLQAGLQVRARGGRVRQPLLEVARHQPLAGADDGLRPAARAARGADARHVTIPEAQARCAS